MPWRPANIKDFSGSQAAHVVNQLFRETNIRIDSISKNSTPILRGQASLNYGTIGAGSCVDRPIHMLGVNSNHVPQASPVTTIGAGLSWSAQIASSNNVNVRVCNATTSPVAANTITWKVVAQ